ncbi:hypothetical protein ACNS7O_01735 [Haloferacaceae archaeon DSL9]
MTGYYDYVLGLIPLVLFGFTATLSIIGIPLTVAVPVGASVAILIIGHALFVNVPVAHTGMAESPASEAPRQPNQLNAD